ncbi:MAG: YqaJ viral recombinase family protein [Candidatus Paceibacterota bacterium]|jgi:putative phage-type endonuclease
MTYKPIVIEVSKQSDEAAWQEERRKHVTATDAPRIAHIAPESWGGPLTVWLEKKGQAKPYEATEGMEIGEFMEDTIAKMFEWKVGQKTTPSNVMLVNPNHPFMACSLDRWTEDSKGILVPLELKNVGEYLKDEWEGEVPAHYQIQVQHQLAVTGAPYAWIAPLIGGNKFRPSKILRDDRLIDELIEMERKFWNLVETDQAPAIDDSKEAEEVLRLVHPESTAGKSVELDVDLQAVYKKLSQARVAEAMLKTEIQGYKNRLMEAMADAEEAYIPGQEKPVVTYRGSKTRRFNSTRFVSEHPEQAAPYYTESTSRRFLVKGEVE